MQAEGGCSSQLGSASEVMDPMRLMRRMDALIAEWTSEDLMDGALPLSGGAANRAPLTAASPAGELGCPYGLGGANKAATL